MSDALRSLNDVDEVVQALAQLAAERCLESLELAADLHGVGTHLFPVAEGEEPDALTVTFYEHKPRPDRPDRPWAEPGYVCRLRVPWCPTAGGVIDRDTALKMLVTDKAIRAMQ